MVSTSLAYEQDWNRDKFGIDLPLCVPFQQAAAAYVNVSNGKRPRTCSRISVHYSKTSYDTCAGTNVWPQIGSQFAENSWKLDKVDITRCTWPFEAKNRYDARLANRRAPCLWFVLGFIIYLFLAKKWLGIPVITTKNFFFLSLFHFLAFLSSPIVFSLSMFPRVL